MNPAGLGSLRTDRSSELNLGLGATQEAAGPQELDPTTEAGSATLEARL